MSNEHHVATMEDKNNHVKMDEVPSSYEEALQLYVGEKYDYYKRKWAKKGKNGDPSFSFNVAGFFGTYWWFAGRGMFLPLIIALIVFVLDDLIVVATGSSLLSSSVGISFAIVFFFGFMSNYFYYKRADKRVKQLLREGKPRQDFVSAGGFRWSFFFIALGITLVYAIISAILVWEYYE
ncbi:DUF2628 domain-containing protein [Halalkalibacterium halodurans]|jgi:hypothetical protein|uniref:DUF2628 domain-containing protein n=1 Tax=Halalkalibacterium halodurans TaxID=86665 RepID=UPI002E1D0BA9|nr:DUF2628 domain-containing protein [Halalkalibacterium halodurans]